MKQSRKKLLINISLLALALLGIILYYILKALPDKKKQSMLGKVALISNKTKSDFISIDVQYRDENGFPHKTRLSNINGNWTVTQPLLKTANQGIVNQMIDNLLTIHSETNYSDISPSQLTNYGIYQPNDIFTFRFKDGSQTSIINGNVSKPESYYYTLKLEETNTIYIIYAYKFSSAELTTSQLLEKQIFTDPIPDIDAFSINALDGQNYSVYREQKDDKTIWYLKSPKALLADEFAVKKRILNFYSLHILEYLKFNREPGDLKTLGLDKPVLSISTTTKDENMDLYISAVTNVLGYFAYSPRIPGIFVIRAEDIARTFELNAKEFEPDTDNNE